MGTKVSVTVTLSLLLFLHLQGAGAQGQTEALGNSNNEFALAMYQKINEVTDGNIFFSPLSINVALAMTYLGAKGNTATQMEKVLNFDDLNFYIHESFKTLLADFNGNTDYILKIANRLYGADTFEIIQQYIQQTGDFYKAPLERMDFAGNPSGSRDMINQWIEEKTMEKIIDFLPEGFIDASTVLILINAIYFKADWKYQFETSKTAQASFNVNSTKFVKTDMMNMDKSKFKWSLSDELQSTILSMPYKGEDITFNIILPNEVDGLSALESALTIEKLNTALTKLNGQELPRVSIPKFEMKQKISLVKMLIEMGMTDLFGNADLSGITVGGGLAVSEVLHEAYIKVNEEGTEAAAVTVVEMVRSMPIPLPPFIADHPFLYFIREEQTGTILFMGRYVEPTAADDVIGQSVRSAHTQNPSQDSDLSKAEPKDGDDFTGHIVQSINTKNPSQGSGVSMTIASVWVTCMSFVLIFYGII